MASITSFGLLGETTHGASVSTPTPTENGTGIGPQARPREERKRRQERSGMRICISAEHKAVTPAAKALHTDTGADAQAEENARSGDPKARELAFLGGSVIGRVEKALQIMISSAPSMCHLRPRHRHAILPPASCHATLYMPPTCSRARLNSFPYKSFHRRFSTTTPGWRTKLAS